MLWEDTLSCGHTRVIDWAFIDRDKQVGDPAVCYRCNPDNTAVTITATRRLDSDG